MVNVAGKYFGPHKFMFAHIIEKQMKYTMWNDADKRKFKTKQYKQLNLYINKYVHEKGNITNILI